MLSVIEFLDLEYKQFALISYIFLLDFAYEHSANIISKIDKPELWEETNYLNSTNNSINQLNVVSHPSININTRFNSLLSVVDNTSTPIGKRLLRERLLNPIVDRSILNKRYGYVDSFLKKDYVILDNSSCNSINNSSTSTKSDGDENIKLEYLYKTYEEPLKYCRNL